MRPASKLRNGKSPDKKIKIFYCSSSECDVLHGECIQTYVPYLFLVIPLGPVTLTGQVQNFSKSKVLNGFIIKYKKRVSIFIFNPLTCQPHLGVT